MTNAEIMKSIINKIQTLKKSEPEKFEENPIKLDEIFLKEIENLAGELEEEKLKHLIKVASIRALKLNPKDIVMVRNRQIVIKRFVPPKPKLTPTEKIKLFKKEFTSKKLKSAISEIVDKMMNGELNFREINNVYFMYNHQRIIQNYIQSEIEKNFPDEDRATIELYSAYVLKNYMGLIMRMIAEYMVELLIEKDENTSKMIAYYDGDVEIDEESGKKYLRPEMFDENGSKWNQSNVLPVIIQHKKDKEALVRKKEEIRKGEAEVQRLNAIVDEKSSILKDMNQREEEAEEERESIQKQVDKAQRELAGYKSKVSEKNSYESEIQDLSTEIRHLMRDEQALLDEVKELRGEKITIKSELQNVKEEKMNKEEKLFDDKKKEKALKQSQEVIKEKNRLVITAIELTLPKLRTPYSGGG